MSEAEKENNENENNNQEEAEEQKGEEEKGDKITLANADYSKPKLRITRYNKNYLKF